jgi:predicted phosphodiesterase
MRIALIADIHGNLAALEAVLAAIEQERPDEIVCLGDVAAMGPQPRETLHRLRALGCPVVTGNADAELLDPSAMPAETDDACKFREMTAWATAQLDAADRAFIASFQPTVGIALSPQRRLLCCHGSPRSFDDVIVAATPDDDLAQMLSDAAAAVIAGGHTHVRMLRAWRGRELVNPGSIGLAYEFFPDGSVRVPPWVEFAILSYRGETLDVDFRRVPYDREATLRAMHERGMPHTAWWSADWR